MSRIFITGAAGFIGTNLVNHLKSKSNITGLATLDKMGYGAGNFPDVKFIYSSLQNLSNFLSILDDVDVVVHLAAETHVDRSQAEHWTSAGFENFYDNNVTGTLRLLEAIRHSKNPHIKLVYISTDEVFGPWDLIGDGTTENGVLDPHNPYSATKAAAEMLVKGWAHQYKYDTVICRLSNVFGPYQYPEKLIPKAVIRVLKGESVPLYGDGSQMREWFYVEDVCTAIEACINYVSSHSGLDSFNFSTSWDCTNNFIMSYIRDVLPEAKIEYVPDRPGHDRRYKLDSFKARKVLGWEPSSTLQDRVHETVKWYVENKAWWERILNKVPNVLSKQPWTEKWN